MNLLSKKVLASDSLSDLLPIAIQFAIDVTADVFQTAIDAMGKNHTYRKEDGTEVTEADVACEKMLLERLQQVFPHHSVLGEEGSSFWGTSEAFCWLIDPISGTKNYANNRYPFGTILALCYQNEPILGVFRYLEGKGKKQTLCYAVKDEGSFIDGEKVTLPPFNARLPLATLRCLGENFAGFVLGRYKGLSRPIPGDPDSRPSDLADISAGSLFVQEAGGIFVRYHPESNVWSSQFTQTPLTHLHRLEKTIPFIATHRDFLVTLLTLLNQHPTVKMLIQGEDIRRRTWHIHPF